MTATKRAGKWKYGDCCERNYGPIKATIWRQWGLTPSPTGYEVYLSTGFKTFIPICDIGCEWFDDEAKENVCRIADKMIKTEIRSWLK